MDKVRGTDVQPRLEACQFFACQSVNKRPLSLNLSHRTSFPPSPRPSGHGLTFATFDPCVAMATAQLPIVCPSNVLLTNEKQLL